MNAILEKKDKDQESNSCLQDGSAQTFPVFEPLSFSGSELTASKENESSQVYSLLTNMPFIGLWAILE